MKGTPLEVLNASCGNMQVYLFTEDSKGFLRISLDASENRLEKRNEFNLKRSKLISVTYEEYDQDMTPLVCNDLMPVNPPKLLLREAVKKGIIQIHFESDEYRYYLDGETYRVEIELHNVDFENTPKPVSLEIDDVTLGWLPG